MEIHVLERIISSAVNIGCIQTLSKLGLYDEDISAKQAYAMYSEKLVKEWRSKRWITGYLSGNTKRATHYFKRSELEVASRMLDIYNITQPTVIFRKPGQAELDKMAIGDIQKRVNSHIGK